MSRNPVRELRQDIVAAYEAHDRVALEQHLDRMERMFSYTGPLPPPAPPPSVVVWPDRPDLTGA